MKTKTVAIPEGEYMGQEVVLKTLTFGDECDISDELEANTLPNGESPKGLGAVVLLERSLVSAPFPINRESIRELDPEIGKFLLEQAMEMSRPLQERPSKVS